MEGVNHIDIVQICGSSLISQINRVFNRNIPDWEGLEFGITGLDAAFIFMIKLRQAGSHLPASGAGGGHDHERFGGFDIIILTVPLIAHDKRHIAGITVDRIVAVNTDVHMFQFLLKRIGAGLPGIVGNYDTAHIEPFIRKSLDEAEYVHVISNTEIRADFVLLNIRSTDGNYNLSLISQLQQHPKLTVGSKTRQNPGSMKIIKQLPAELEVKLIPKLINTLADVIRLRLQIFVIVKT